MTGEGAERGQEERTEPVSKPASEPASTLWQPGATLATLKARAEMLAAMRAFFQVRGVMEVDTPMLSRHATVDRHIESFAARPGAAPNAPPRADDPPRWLHTSPEFAMKRLLAAGSGPIYQLCHVFRAEEAGRHHNPEFLMLEWYRPGWDYHRLMTEVEALLQALGIGRGRHFPRLSYRDAFLRYGGVEPFRAEISVLQRGLAEHGVSVPDSKQDHSHARDYWLDLWMSMVIGPKLGDPTPCFLYDFPTTQAALAKVRGGDQPVAERFELFWQGLELANGFNELTDAGEQELRFRFDTHWRQARNRAMPPYDTHFLDALDAGLPESAGVALGVDRLLMLMLKLPDIASAMAFGADRA